MEPTKKQMDEWYEKFGPLLTIEVEDMKFICREITRKEYKRVVETIEDEYLQEEEICRLSILHPSNINFDEKYAGLPRSMAIEILRESGFGDSPKVGVLVQKYRDEMNEFMNQVSCIIHEAFPMLQLEEIENWHLEKTLWYLSRAEWKLRNFRGIGKQDNGEGEVDGTPDDFPELSAEEAFMSGKMLK